MPQSFASLAVHVVFSTRHRSPSIDPAWEDALHGVIGAVLEQVRCRLLAAGGIADHRHLLISLARDCSLADAVRNLKTASSAWVQREADEMFRWQAGYAAFATSHSQTGRVRAYIADQVRHHQGYGYQDEVRGLLKRHGIESDEEHMWD